VRKTVVRADDKGVERVLWIEQHFFAVHVRALLRFLRQAHWFDDARVFDSRFGP